MVSTSSSFKQLQQKKFFRWFLWAPISQSPIITLITASYLIIVFDATHQFCKSFNDCIYNPYTASTFLNFRKGFNGRKLLNNSNILFSKIVEHPYVLEFSVTRSAWQFWRCLYFFHLFLVMFSQWFGRRRRQVTSSN